MVGILDVFSKASQTPSLATISRAPSDGSRTCGSVWDQAWVRQPMTTQ